MRGDDFACLERARRDPYSTDVVAVDEERFIDMARSTMTVGWEEDFVEGGRGWRGGGGGGRGEYGRGLTGLVGGGGPGSERGLVSWRTLMAVGRWGRWVGR